MSEKLSERLWNYGDTELARMAEALEARIEVLEKVLRQAEGSLRLAMVTMPAPRRRSRDQYDARAHKGRF